MKIAYIYDTIYPYTFGGVEKRIWEISIRLVQKGHEVHIFGPKFWEGDCTFKKDGVYLHGICKPPKRRFVDGKRSTGWPILFAWKVLTPLLRKKFDIIDCQSFPYFPCFSAKLASALKRSHLVITWIEVWDQYWYEYMGKQGILGKFIEKLTIALSNNMISISETTTSRLVRLNSGNRNIATIPIGIDLESIRSVEPSGQVSDIIFAGRMIKEKNIDILIKSVSLLKKEYPNITAVIIGDGPESMSLQQLATDLGVIDNIRFIGPLENYDDLIAHLKSSRVFVFPSTREGFGIVVVEANACGLPVIVIDHERNAACDLVKDCQNGFICQLSAEAIAEKVEIVLSGKVSDARAKCVQYAERYKWTNIIDSIENIYSSLMKTG